MARDPGHDRIRATLTPAIERFADAARTGCPRARVQVNIGHSEAFPFYATVGLSEPDPAGDEVAVLSIDVWKDGRAVRASCDLAEGGGSVLAQGPVRTLVAPIENCPDLADWLRDAEAFVDACCGEAVRVGSARGL